MTQPRETFLQFVARNPNLKPTTGETMNSIYEKQLAAFEAYVDEQVALKLAEIDAKFGLPASE